MTNCKIMEYGFVAYTGIKWSNQQVDNYNAITKRIIAFGDNPPEYLINSRHKLFWMYSQPTQSPK